MANLKCLAEKHFGGNVAEHGQEAKGKKIRTNAHGLKGGKRRLGKTC